MIQNPPLNQNPQSYPQGQTYPLQNVTSAWTGAPAQYYVPMEPVSDDAYLILWFNSSTHTYERWRGPSDQETVEKVNDLLQKPECSQILVFELTHQWEREWKKK